MVNHVINANLSGIKQENCFFFKDFGTMICMCIYKLFPKSFHQWDCLILAPFLMEKNKIVAFSPIYNSLYIYMNEMRPRLYIVTQVQ